MGNPNQIKKICLHQQPLLRFSVQIDPMLKWLQILKYWQMISIIVLDKFCFYYRQWIGSYVDRNIFVKETFASFHHLKPTTWVFLLNSILSKWWVPDIKHKVMEWLKYKVKVKLLLTLYRPLPTPSFLLSKAEASCSSPPTP